MYHDEHTDRLTLSLLRKAQRIEADIRNKKAGTSALQSIEKIMKHASSDPDAELRIAGIEKEKSRLNSEIDELIDLWSTIEGAVNALFDGAPDRQVMGDIIKRRYLYGQTWLEIADQLHYTERYVLRIHARACEIIQNQ